MQNQTNRTSIKKIISAIVTQGVILALSFITGFILPKYMGTEMYGYWQKYLFYLAYVNIVGLGFNDGLALFYSGVPYENLPNKRIRSGTRIFYIVVAAFTALLAILTYLFTANDPIQRKILLMIVINIPSVCLQCVTLTMFLSTNKTGIYNTISLVTRVLSVVFYLVMLYLQWTSANSMMFADSLARLLISFVCFVCGRKFLLGKDVDYKLGLIEFTEKSKAGLHITIGLIAAGLIPLAGRMVVEWAYPIKIYGVFSFAISLLSIVITFTNAAGLVVFPVLKTIDTGVLPSYYQKVSKIYSGLVYFAFLLYIPLVIIVGRFMTDYISSFAYIHIILAMCLPLGKVQLLINAYYKAFRMEKLFLVINLVSLAGAFLLTYLVNIIFGSIVFVAGASTLSVFIWQIVLEWYLHKKMQTPLDKMQTLKDLFFMIIFICAASFENLLLFIAIYGVALLLYILSNRKYIQAFLLNQKRKSKEQ